MGALTIAVEFLDLAIGANPKLVADTVKGKPREVSSSFGVNP